MLNDPNLGLDEASYGDIAGGRMVKTWGWQSMIQLFLVIAVVAILITIWFAFEDYRRFKPTAGDGSYYHGKSHKHGYKKSS